MALEVPIQIAQETHDYVDEARDVYDDGFLRVEHDNYYVACDGRRIPLCLKEFLILSFLARKPERVVTTHELWQQIWGKERPIAEMSVRVHISRVRHKLMPFGIGIESMPGIGYRLIVPDCCNDKTNERGDG